MDDDGSAWGDDGSGHERRTTRAPVTDSRFEVPLRGVAVGPETRCAHWDSELDVVALRFGCCGAFSPCHTCHVETADHDPEPWPRARFDDPAVLCGVCGTTLSARIYLDGDSEERSPSGSRAKPDDDSCPACGAGFNPGCRRHRDRYFES